VADDVNPEGFFTCALKARRASLRASLAEGRVVHDHPTASGDHSELDWLTTLAQFLPNRYRVSRGSVVDATGTTSDDIDLIIHDAQYTPINARTLLQITIDM